MQWNTLFSGRLYFKNMTNKSINSFIKEEDPDILMLCEINDN